MTIGQCTTRLVPVIKDTAKIQFLCQSPQAKGYVGASIHPRNAKTPAIKTHSRIHPSIPSLLQFVQMLQPRQNNLLTRLLNLPRQKHLVQNGIDLVKVEDQIQLAHIPKERIQHLHEEVNSFQVGELVVVGVHAGAEEEARVPAVDDLVVPELDEVGLVFLVAGGHEAVDLEGLFSWGVVVGWMGGGGLTSPLSFIFSSSSYGRYHFARRVLPCLFCMRMNDNIFAGGAGMLMFGGNVVVRG